MGRAGVMMVAALVLAGCSQGPSGRYEDRSGLVFVDFMGDGEAMVGGLGMAGRAQWKAQGDVVYLVTGADGSALQLKKRADGCYEWTLGVLCKTV
ncbi:hypothetical protein [Sandaracinobacteroides saxicola]|uniref:Lipoprotein n=1 Tax=Sandaracinobacteroides saxicola TaxID=2759707 RepID=A0A7G5IJQ6_9SPHN|nr:hypothetical protein [Sandaracinobacteroides saxicola]QMW23598.1 hypothetical protein H3309_03635 [Sandaracinobacteroides saxicola]